ncbi:conserved unknown protein [Ectocarpus siliculosus]|uniref:Uncharacterized protein n=1 Tax=Ectocarpus siliculosus TaxID=2880 RepID=D8LKG2_ECTSI|nr:conserved unknown protein [Ectocarpus siliculosus]|eukprot:CBN74552.1 conserved unknown protein [Ectocarpus siliculosus]
MRVTRAKQYRKHLRFFRIVYGISAPYKVILDGNFIHGCISSKVDIEKRLTSVLQLHYHCPDIHNADAATTLTRRPGELDLANDPHRQTTNPDPSNP